MLIETKEAKRQKSKREGLNLEICILSRNKTSRDISPYFQAFWNKKEKPVTILLRMIFQFYHQVLHNLIISTTRKINI